MKHVLTLAALVLAACGREVPTETATATAEQEILNGYDARSPLFDAIGALVFVNSDGSLVPFCTGTLVAPQVVLTAKHCKLVLSGHETLAFVTGPDARAPKKRVAIRSMHIELETSGRSIMDLGSDSAVAILETPITDVRPLELKSTNRSDLNDVFLAIGYGRQFEPQTLDFSAPPTPAASGARMLAPLRIKALGGDRYYEAVFHDYATFKHEYALSNPNLADPQELETAAQRTWETLRVPDFELLAQSAIFNQQWGTAAGDSGGPLLALTPSGFKVAGVVSGVRFEYYPGMPNPAYQYGTVYAAVNANVRTLVDAARGCLAVTVQGVCSATGSLERCVLAHRRVGVQSTSCGANTSCRQSPLGASCAAACVANSDCDASAPEGVCTAGRCEWSPFAACHAYRAQGESACVYCCSGAATSFEEFFSCYDGCFAPATSATASTSTQIRVSTPAAKHQR